MAIVSLVCSAAIITNVVRDEKKRATTYGQLMVTMSAFDVVGSAAYALTSLPTPTTDFIYGSMGNKASCKSQGFFIQMGTIAALINVSLAVYYLLMIKFSVPEHRIKKYRGWLIGLPIAGGMIVAFAGIPSYFNILLWCNNCTNWWLELPIVVAMFMVTIIMSIVCHHVFAKTRAARMYGASSEMSWIVFSQSLFYLASFYLVWPLYLSLQFLWGSGKTYHNYGFTLTAATLVTMQGFWNSVVFFRRGFNIPTCKVGRNMSSFVSRRFSTSWESGTANTV